MAKAKRRTAAQKRATAKLVAFNRGKRKLKRNPIAKKRRARRVPAAGYTVGSAPVRRRKMNPIRRRRRARGRSRMVAKTARRRNPIRRAGLLGRVLNNTVMPAVTATGGALLLDALWSYLPIPVTIKAGPFKHVAKALGAILLAEVAGKVVSKRTAESMGIGALTVVMHAAGREAMAKYVPTVRMDGIGYMSPAVIARSSPALGYYAGSGQLPRAAGNAPAMGMGYYPPATGGANMSTENESNYSY